MPGQSLEDRIEQLAATQAFRCRSGAHEATDPVQGLAQAAGNLLIRAGRNVRDRHPDGHPRAVGVVSHGQRAAIAAMPRAVPRQPAHIIVGHEPAAVS